MRTWLARLSLLVLVNGFTHPASAGDINDLFTFPHITYNQYFPSGLISGNGSGGQYLGMGDLTVFFRYSPDPEGGHPLARTLHFSGFIPELGITEDNWDGGVVLAGVIIEDPEEFPGFLRFLIAEDGGHPALGGLGVGGTWDVPLPLAVPVPAAGLLLGAGALLLAMRMRRLI